MKRAPDTLQPALEWRAEAACARSGLDPECWFAVGAGPAVTADLRRAVTVCEGCPVRQPCLDEALAVERGVSSYGRFGIFGGLDAVGRADLAKGAAA